MTSRVVSLLLLLLLLQRQLFGNIWALGNVATQATLLARRRVRAQLLPWAGRLPAVPLPPMTVSYTHLTLPTICSV
eukprot:7116305-Prymnesium_polylepis.1